ncbi:D-2-hydroxyacid dehydrogenase [Sphingobium sp. CR28]|uniref:D-2-hydroxyacid dehydrogenase n=1 Tax=Sphingobium sp. CR28 TaxID=3400272 RepID=UPI003FF00FBB
MADRPVIVAPAMIRPLVEPLLPDAVEMRWFASTAEAVDMAPDADIGWFDAFTPETRAQASLRAEKARWINTIRAGLDDVPIDLLASRGTIVTNGTGLHAQAVADYALLGVLTLAKRLDEIVRAHDRGEWLVGPPGMAELEGSQALIIGYGVIGAAIGTRLAACGAQVVPVRRTADPANGILGAEDWRERLGDMDWVILAAPATDDTRAMIGAAELAAMKPTAGLVNIARGDLIDQAALLAALDSRSIGGAFLDVTTPEPLPPGDPLWKAPRSLVTMHMSGRSQTSLFRKGAERFARNLRAWLAGEPLEAVVDPARGY